MTKDEVLARLPAQEEQVRVEVVKGTGSDGREYVGGSVEGIFKGYEPESAVVPGGRFEIGGIRVDGKGSLAARPLKYLIAFGGITGITAA